MILLDDIFSVFIYLDFYDFLESLKCSPKFRRFMSICLQIFFLTPYLLVLLLYSNYAVIKPFDVDLKVIDTVNFFHFVSVLCT